MTISYPVPPQDIRNKLDDLWNSQETRYKMRASLFNLIFFTKKSPREDYTRKIALKLVEKFPARIFFISLDSSSPNDPLTTSVSVLSSMQGEFAVTCDLIEMRTGDAGKEKIPFILLPHIIPDLPVFLVWSADPSSEESLRRELEPFVTRIIFDSETAENFLNFAQMLLSLQKTFSGELADLNWARLANWRTLISSVFASPDLLQGIQTTSTMTITFNEQETPSFCHTKIQSIYLQAWFASRLKWKQMGSQDDSFLSFLYQTQHGQVSVQLNPVKEATLPPGMILSLSLTTKEGDEYLFSRKKTASNQISFEHSTPSLCSIPTRLQEPKGESGHSLIQEICQKGTSEHYLETLQLIARGMYS